MAEIKPSEVSAIIRQQLANFSDKKELEETGVILEVGDGIARVLDVALKRGAADLVCDEVILVRSEYLGGDDLFDRIVI